MKTLVCFISHYLLQIVEGGYWTRSTFLLLQPQIAYPVALIYVPYPCITFCSISWRVFFICPAQIICNISYNSTKDFHRHTQPLEYFSLILHQIYLPLPQSFLMKPKICSSLWCWKQCYRSNITWSDVHVKLSYKAIRFPSSQGQWYMLCRKVHTISLFLSYTVSSVYQSPVLSSEVYDQCCHHFSLSKSNWNWNCSQKNNNNNISVRLLAFFFFFKSSWLFNGFIQVVIYFYLAKYSLADLLNRFCVWTRHTSVHYLLLGRQHRFEMVTLMLLLS